jgi:hypothetical protein
VNGIWLRDDAGVNAHHQGLNIAEADALISSEGFGKNNRRLEVSDGHLCADEDGGMRDGSVDELSPLLPPVLEGRQCLPKLLDRHNWHH